MANISKANLQDKDIRNLATPTSRKKIAVGNPKELYLWLHPTGKKIFFIKLPNAKTYSLGEFREGIYSVSEARKEAQKVLKELSSGKDIEAIKGKSDKYKFKHLFLAYLDGKISKGLKTSYTDKIKGHFTHYVLPKIGKIDAKDIKYSTMRDILMPIFNPNNPAQSRLRTIHEIITHLHSIFAIAIKDDYIAKDPSFGLSDEFLTARKFAQKNNICTNMPAITDPNTLKEFLTDLKNDNKMDFQTKNAVYLQILTANRPANTASAKWEDIDLNKGIWVIPASEMKMGASHTVALSK